MADRKIKVDLVGDSADFDRAMSSASKSVDKFDDHLDKADKGSRDFSDSLDETTKKSRSGKDVLDGFSDVMESFGVTLPGPIGNMATMAGGVADLADGFGGLLGPALKKAQVGFKLMNATMRANPILTVVTVIALLTAAFIVAYKKSETFRKIVDGALKGVRVAVKFVVDAVKGYFDIWLGVLQSVIDKLEWVIQKAKDAAGMIKKVAGYTPAGLAGKGLGKIGGLFANGGDPPVGVPSIVGENGPEVIVPRGQMTVLPNGSGRNAPVTVNVYGDLKGAIKKIVRVDGAGSAEMAFR